MKEQKIRRADVVAQLLLCNTILFWNYFFILNTFYYEKTTKNPNYNNGSYGCYFDDKQCLSTYRMQLLLRYYEYAKVKWKCCMIIYEVYFFLFFMVLKNTGKNEVRVYGPFFICAWHQMTDGS